MQEIQNKKFSLHIFIEKPITRTIFFSIIPKNLFQTKFPKLFYPHCSPCKQQDYWGKVRTNEFHSKELIIKKKNEEEEEEKEWDGKENKEKEK